MPDATTPNLPTRLRQLLASKRHHYTCPASGAQAFAIIATEDRLADLALAATTLEKAEQMAAALTQANASLETVRLQHRQDAEDTDKLLRLLGLDLSDCLTEGGWLNLPRIAHLLHLPDQGPAADPQAACACSQATEAPL